MNQVWDMSKRHHDKCKQWLERSGHQDNYISDLFNDYLLLLATLHKPELIEQDHHLITKDYELPLLDPPINDATEARLETALRGRRRMSTTPKVKVILLSSLLIAYANNDFNLC